MIRQFDITKMRAACKSAARTLAFAGTVIRPGITTDDIDRAVHNHTLQECGRPAPFNYHGFPRSVCTSVNDVVCHGIPGPRILCDGDIVNVDVTTILDGHFGDCNATFVVGNVSHDVQELLDATRDALQAGIWAVRPGAELGAVGAAIEAITKQSGYSIVKEFGGHGISTRFHTPPFVNHYAVDGPFEHVVLTPGMTFTIEPMICIGDGVVKIDADGWTVRTVDGSWSAQFEHTVLVTDDGAEVLTLP